MKALTVLVLLLATARLAAQPYPTAATSARSVSGQFYVTALPNSGTLPAAGSVNDPALIRLEPTMVAISCERIKQTVWRELDYRGSWQQKVVIALHAARSTNETVTIVSDRSNDGWNYRVAMPDTLPRERYLKAVVQVVLSEFANRRVTRQPAEVPVWLTEGLTFQLLCNNSPELLLDPPRQRAGGLLVEPRFVDIRRFSPLEKAHKILVGTTPLTFEELSWPLPGQYDGANAAVSQASSQLLVCELLKLADGPECMRSFLSSLPEYLNWQMAFLHGFAPHFQRPLDVEKWWALECLEFAGRDLTQTWPYELSWTKLAGALAEPVDVYTSTNALPERSAMSLQSVVRAWPGEKHKEVLRRKSGELAAMRLRIAPELADLTGRYLVAINLYLERVGKPAAPLSNVRAAPRGDIAAQYQLLRSLERLDAERERLRPSLLQNTLATSNATIDTSPEMRLPAPRLRAN